MVHSLYLYTVVSVKQAFHSNMREFKVKPKSRFHSMTLCNDTNSYFKRSKMENVEPSVYKKHLMSQLPHLGPKFHCGAVFTGTKLFSDDVDSQINIYS